MARPVVPMAEGSGSETVSGCGYRKKAEGGELILVVGTTNKVKTGKRVTVNFSANCPSPRATTPQI